MVDRAPAAALRSRFQGDATVYLIPGDPVRNVRHTGTRIVRSMPAVFRVISVVGTVAMLWVGGHILLVGVDDLGWHWPYEQVHHFEEWVHDGAPFLAGFFGWLANTLCSAAVGVLVGGLVAAVMHQVHARRHHHAS